MIELVLLGLLLLLGFTVELTYRFAGALPLESISDDAWSATQSGIVTLVAFIIGFSFAQASERFDARRVLIVKEANAIGTTWLRADNLPSGASGTFRRVLAEYTTTRLSMYEVPVGSAPYTTALGQSGREQSQLWPIARAALHAHRGDLGLSLLMQSLNDTIDVSAEQIAALTNHVPAATTAITIFLTWLAAFSLGIRFARSKSRPLLMSTLTVITYSLVLTMIIDYDRPQSGFIKVSLAPLATQLQSMREEQLTVP